MRVATHLLTLFLILITTSCSRPSLKQQNHLGIVFECRQCSQIEVPTVGLVAVTGFQVKNIPPGECYELKVENSAGLLDTKTVFVSDINGKLLQRENGTVKSTLDTVRIIENDKFRGQPSKFWLISKDGTTTVSCSYVPYPIETHAKDGASLSHVRESYDAQIFTLHAKNFHPNELLIFTSRSGTEILQTIFSCDQNGMSIMGIAPAVIGLRGGKASLAIQRLNNETLSINYEWGKEAVSPDKLIAPSAKIPRKCIEEHIQENKVLW